LSSSSLGIRGKLVPKQLDAEVAIF